MGMVLYESEYGYERNLCESYTSLPNAPHLNKSGLIAKYAGVGREAIRRSELY